MKFLSLFAGIGGMDLGLERAGMRCVGQVEIDPFCRKVLAKHWPDVPKWSDIRDFDGSGLREHPDLIYGGFPCQDISNAGKRAGIDGERSGLWSEYARVVRVLRPRYVLVENVAALLGRGLDRVLGDLAESGYDAEWDCIPASAVGAPHIRDRLFVVAYAAGERRNTRPGVARDEERPRGWRRESGPGGEVLADAESIGGALRRAEGERPGRLAGGGSLPHPILARLEGHERGVVAHADGWRQRADAAGSDWWAAEPDVGRVAHGVPARVDRLRGLGNAVVPQVAEVIGRAIMLAPS